MQPWGRWRYQTGVVRMGFSVSGAAVLLFAGLLVAFGMWSTATANSVERVQESETARLDRMLERTHTTIEITATTWDGADTLTVTVSNRGERSWWLSEMDVVVDGAYRTAWSAGSPDLFRPGDSRQVNIDLSAKPDRVKLVADAGIADAAEVT